ncbi:MAG: sensor histidine kinase [Chromatiales bacterium]|nr:sensor histidine kinase [Chromatiales bacterium]
MPLQRKLFWLFSSLTLGPLLLLQYGVVERNARALTESTEQEVHSVLERLEGELQTLLDAQAALVRGLVVVPSVDQFARLASGPTGSGYERAAEEITKFFLDYQSVVPSIQAMRVIDRDGNTLVKVREKQRIEAEHAMPDGRRFVANLASREFFRSALALAPGEVGMSQFELGWIEFKDDWCPAMVRYMTPLGEAGFLVVNMWGRRIDQLVNGTLAEFGNDVAIVERNAADPSRDGVFLFHPDTRQRFGNQTGNPARFAADVGEAGWAAILAGSADGTIEHGDRFWFYRAFAPDARSDLRWVLVASRSREAVLAPVEGMRRTIWVLLGVLAVVSIALVRWSSESIARPVENLVALMRRYADGERVRYEDARADEIGSLGRTFNYLTDRLEQAQDVRCRAEAAAARAARLAMVGELAAGVAHEINNPMNNMLGLTELMQRQPLPAALRGDLDVLASEGRRVARIVQGLLDYARPRAPHVERLDLAELARESVRLLDKQAEQLGVRLEVQGEDGSAVDGDRAQLQQVIVNLVLNGMQASPRGGTVSVNVRSDGEWAEARVVDSGTGIDANLLPRMFEPFFTTKGERGTGLGLSVSDAIVRQHGGSMGARQESAGGLCVWFHVPAATVEDRSRLPGAGTA